MTTEQAQPQLPPLPEADGYAVMSKESITMEAKQDHVPGPCELAFMRGLKVQVSEAEIAELIELSSPEHPYTTTFSGGAAQLWAHPRAKWAYIAVDGIRARAAIKRATQTT